MAVYRGILQNGKLVKASSTAIKVVSTSKDSTVVAFPADVRMAYVQATNRFIDDRITLGPLTVWSVKTKPKELAFENGATEGGGGKWLCFEVDTAAALTARSAASSKKVRARTK